jgi:hypothetical protein
MIAERLANTVLPQPSLGTWIPAGATPPATTWPSPTTSATAATPSSMAADSGLVLTDEDSASRLERLLRRRIRQLALVLLTASATSNAAGIALLALANEPLANILMVLIGEGTLLLAVPPALLAVRQLRSSATT